MAGSVSLNRRINQNKTPFSNKGNILFFVSLSIFKHHRHVNRPRTHWQTFEILAIFQQKHESKVHSFPCSTSWHLLVLADVKLHWRTRTYFALWFQVWTTASCFPSWDPQPRNWIRRGSSPNKPRTISTAWCSSACLRHNNTFINLCFSQSFLSIMQSTCGYYWPKFVVALFYSRTSGVFLKKVSETKEFRHSLGSEEDFDSGLAGGNMRDKGFQCSLTRLKTERLILTGIWFAFCNGKVQHIAETFPIWYPNRNKDIRFPLSFSLSPFLSPFLSLSLSPIYFWVGKYLQHFSSKTMGKQGLMNSDEKRLFPNFSATYQDWETKNCLTRCGSRFQTAFLSSVPQSRCRSRLFLCSPRRMAG